MSSDKTTAFKFGREFTNGALYEISKWLWFPCLLILVLLVMRNTFEIGLDTTDKSGWKRSGLSLHIDNATGVEYLSDSHGGLHVRLNADGSIHRSQP